MSKSVLNVIGITVLIGGLVGIVAVILGHPSVAIYAGTSGGVVVLVIVIIMFLRGKNQPKGG